MTGLQKVTDLQHMSKWTGAYRCSNRLNIGGTAGIATMFAIFIGPLAAVAMQSLKYMFDNS